MSSKHRLTRSFRTVSAILYLLNIICALNFAWIPNYLHILVGVFVTAMSMVMLSVAVEGPGFFTERLENSKLGETLFTFRGRYVMDLFIALFLFAMPPWGVVLGGSTLLLIFGIRFLGVKQPDAFNEIFRQADMMESTADSYTLESEYDTPVVAMR
jgi:hypothetical protein